MLGLGVAFALVLSVPVAAEEAAPKATSPSGASEAAAPGAEKPAAPAEKAPVPEAPEKKAAAPAEKPAAPAEQPPSAEPAPAEAAATEAPVVEQADAKPAEAAKPAAEAAPRHAIVLGPVVKDAKGQEGRIHEVKPGDTLWEISDAYLGTPWVWPSVWKSNEEIQNPHRIYPGDKLFVSASEMRRLSPEEAAQMLAGQAPAALADGMEMGAAVPKTYRVADIDTVGFVSTEALRGAAAIVDSTVDRVWLGDHDTVIIGVGEGETAVGDRFDIFRTTNVVDDPETGIPVGHATLSLGWLEVQEVHPESSIAVIRVSRNEIRRGDHLLPRVAAGSEIPVGAKPEVDGRVVYTWADRIEMGGNDVVYLNRGEAAGLQIGSPLEVYRAIGTAVDDAQWQVKQLPDHVIARLLVVSTTGETATAVVTHAATEIEVGDSFRGSDTIWY
jgi:LysM repeat protein